MEVGLITPVYAEEMMIDGFDLRDGLFVLEIDTEPEFLEAQGFAEQEGVRQRKISGKHAAWCKTNFKQEESKRSITNGD
jgi:hypothetical protein